MCFVSGQIVRLADRVIQYTKRQCVNMLFSTVKRPNSYSSMIWRPGKSGPDARQYAAFPTLIDDFLKVFKNFQYWDFTSTHLTYFNSNLVGTEINYNEVSVVNLFNSFREDRNHCGAKALKRVIIDVCMVKLTVFWISIMFFWGPIVLCGFRVFVISG